jgi:hypothetical protein
MVGLAGALALAACVSDTYQVQSAVSPPTPRPVAPHSLPMERAQSFYLDHSSVVGVGSPRDGAPTDNGIRVPKDNLESGMRLRRSAQYDLALFLDYGSPRRSYRLEDDTLADTGDYYGLGAAWNFHTPKSASPVRVSFHLSALLMAVPYIQISNEQGSGSPDVSKDVDIEPLFRVGVAPSYDLGNGARLYLGVRTAPVVSSRANGAVTTQSGPPGSPVTTDGLDFDAALGIDASIDESWHVGAYLHQPFFSGVVDYRPMLGATLSYAPE